MAKVQYQINDTFYDIESLKNIFTIVAYKPHEEQKEIDIYVHLDENHPLHDEVYSLENKKLMLEEIKKVYESYILENVSSINFKDLREFVKEQRLGIDDRLFGFNSHNYDEVMLAYLFQKSSPLSASKYQQIELPKNKDLRKFSDDIIHSQRVKDAFGKDYSTSSRYYDMLNSKRFLDITTMNESLRFGSLKRLSAQAGFTIKESDKLSGENAYIETMQDIAELVAYNVADTVNTKRLFERKEYLTAFTQRSQLLERFKDKFDGRLSEDSTSAKFIEYVISPRHKAEPLSDDKRINIFYPVNLDAPENTKLKEIDQLFKTEDIEDKNQYLIDELNLNEETPRYRYDEVQNRIEEDLLEMTKEDVDLPQAVYDMYAGIRKQASLDNARESLFAKGIVMKKNGRVSIAKKQGVRESNSYIDFSIGGAHGEYYDRNQFLKELDKAEKLNAKNETFNKNLQMLIEDYGDDETGGATTIMLEKREKRLPEKYQDLNPSDFTSGTYKKGHKWKKLKKIKNDSELRQLIKKCAKTVYSENIWHGDVDSLYPTLMTNLGMFAKQLEDGTILDPYADLLHERLALKAELMKVPPNEWTEREYEMDRIQKLNKLLLNAASGVADASFDNNIRVNNKTVRMRICGQLILATLVYRLTDAGATAISTNTDGVFFTRIDEDKVKEIFNTWCTYFSISATPETIDLFITKDSNNRLEVNDGYIQGAAGNTIGLYKGPTLSKSMVEPAVRDATLLKYLKEYENPLEQFDRAYIKENLQSYIDYAKENAPVKALERFQWFFVSNPSKNSFMTPLDTNTDDVIETGKVFRGFMVKDSPYTMKQITLTKQNKEEVSQAREIAERADYITESNKHNNAAFKKITNLPDNNRIEIKQESLEEIDPAILDELDLDVYTDLIESAWESWAEKHVVIN